MHRNRSFTATIAGVSYEIPTTMEVLEIAEEACGASVIECIAERKFGRILRGVLYGGLMVQGVKQLRVDVDDKGQDVIATLSYAVLATACDFSETRENMTALVLALAPRTAGSTAKNVRAEGGRKRSPGPTSSDTPTASSS